MEMDSATDVAEPLTVYMNPCNILKLKDTSKAHTLSIF